MSSRGSPLAALLHEGCLSSDEETAGGLVTLLNKVFDRHRASDDDFDAATSLLSLSKKQSTLFWKAVSKVIAHIAGHKWHSEAGEDPRPQQPDELQALNAAVWLVELYVAPRTGPHAKKKEERGEGNGNHTSSNAAAPKNIFVPQQLWQVVHVLHTTVLAYLMTNTGENTLATPAAAAGPALSSSMRQKLEASIVQMACECFTQHKTGSRVMSMRYVFLSLLDRVLGDAPRVADINLLYRTRHGLKPLVRLLIQQQQDSKRDRRLEKLILRAAIHPFVLQRKPGRKFLAYIFSGCLDGDVTARSASHYGDDFVIRVLPMCREFILRMHESMKQQIPRSKLSLLREYGDIYARTWAILHEDKMARDVVPNPFLDHHDGGNKSVHLLDVFEQVCIQPLMMAATRVGSDATSLAVRTVLNAAFHSGNRPREVDAMLQRMYAPILWRSLRAPNARVRLNATLLLRDAFPIHDPLAPNLQVDAAICRQYDALGELLCDGVVAVRVAALKAACHILGSFWELIPAVTAKNMLTRIVLDLAFDGSAPEVRIAVFHGLREVIETAHLSHGILTLLLPRLAPLLHDKDERVQIAFLDLLDAVKGLKSIFVFDIVSVKSLLQQLQRSSGGAAVGIDAAYEGSVAVRITQLLLKSFFPFMKAASVQQSRALALIRMNARASLCFFGLAHVHVPALAVAKLICILHMSLDLPVETTTISGHVCGMVSSDNGTEMVARTASLAVNGNHEEAGGSDGEGEHYATKILCVMARLWKSLDQRSKDLSMSTDGMESNDDDNAVQQLLQHSFSVSAVKTLLDRFETNRLAREAVLSMAVRLPWTPGADLKLPSLVQLYSLPCNASVDQCEPIVSCAVAWGQHAELLHMIAEGISHWTQEHHAQCSRKRKRGAIVSDSHCASTKDSAVPAPLRRSNRKRSAPEKKKISCITHPASRGRPLSLQISVQCLEYILGNSHFMDALCDGNRQTGVYRDALAQVVRAASVGARTLLRTIAQSDGRAFSEAGHACPPGSDSIPLLFSIFSLYYRLRLHLHIRGVRSSLFPDAFEHEHVTKRRRKYCAASAPVSPLYVDLKSLTEFLFSSVMCDMHVTHVRLSADATVSDGEGKFSRFHHDYRIVLFTSRLLSDCTALGMPVLPRILDLDRWMLRIEDEFVQRLRASLSKQKATDAVDRVGIIDFVAELLESVLRIMYHSVAALCLLHNSGSIMSQNDEHHESIMPFDDLMKLLTGVFNLLTSFLASMDMNVEVECNAAHDICDRVSDVLLEVFKATKASDASNDSIVQLSSRLIRLMETPVHECWRECLLLVFVKSPIATSVLGPGLSCAIATASCCDDNSSENVLMKQRNSLGVDQIKADGNRAVTTAVHMISDLCDMGDAQLKSHAKRKIFMGRLMQALAHVCSEAATAPTNENTVGSVNTSVRGVPGEEDSVIGRDKSLSGIAMDGPFSHARKLYVRLSELGASRNFSVTRER